MGRTGNIDSYCPGNTRYPNVFPKMPRKWANILFHHSVANAKNAETNALADQLPLLFTFWYDLPINLAFGTNPAVPCQIKKKN